VKEPKKTMAEEFVVCRTSDLERARTRDLFDLIPKQGKIALDIGARDGYFSILLAERFDRVVALDLEKPDIDHPRIESVKGDACQLDFGDSTFDLVVCAEVLEHIPTDLLERVLIGKASPLGCHRGVSPRIFARMSSSQAARLRFMRKLHLVLSVVSRRIKLSTIFFRREQILWRVVLAHGAGILAEADVENPVKPVLDAPVARTAVASCSAVNSRELM
jgi:2-polyprenyl-3-methyl-5-hydroxy-6-metoxy-1,4-benzoquinol methylase